MIVVAFDRGTVAWDRSGLTVAADDPATEARVRKLFSKPATVRRSASGPDGLVAEDFETVAPGTAEHFRGAAITLPGATLLLDEAD